MAAITQRIPNFLGGVSRQPDDMKLPGQVKEAINVYPDPTFGLVKRTGTTLQTVLNPGGTGTEYEGAKWFPIIRDQNEKYIACITPPVKDQNGVIVTYGELFIWNLLTGVQATVTYQGTSRNYLSGEATNYSLLTVQDTTFITNNTVNVAEKPVPSAYAYRTKATIRLFEVAEASKYEVFLNGSSTPSATYTTPDQFVITPGTPVQQESTINATVVLNSLQSQLNALSGYTATVIGTTIELTNSTPFSIEVRGGLGRESMSVFQDVVENVAQLPKEATNGRIVKVVNTTNTADTYWAKFIVEAGSGTGNGYWEETISPEVSAGFDASTMPHELIATAVNQFTLRPAAWIDRLVGDNETNAHPGFLVEDPQNPGTFIGKPIQQTFLYNNRLGFLTEDVVSMSQAGDFYNLYHTTALTQTAADPIDLSCSSIRPAVLHSVLPTGQGLLLFSQNQQFIMYAESGVLTPGGSIIRAISNYETTPELKPQDFGTSVVFLNKTANYTRVFNMTTRGQQENPIILEIGKIVSEWIPNTIDSVITSPQNSLLAMSTKSSDTVYFFRFYNDGTENQLQTWFQWKLCGNVQTVFIESDEIYIVTQQGTEYTLLRGNLNQTPTQQILQGGAGTGSGGLVTSAGVPFNPTFDLVSPVLPVNRVYDSNTGHTRVYTPFKLVSGLNPLAVIASDPNNQGLFTSGYYLTPVTGTDGTGDYFEIQNRDVSTQDFAVIVGYAYNYRVELPRFYYRRDNAGKVTDYSASLIIARMKLSVGLTSSVQMTIKSKGRQDNVSFYPSAFGDYYELGSVPVETQRVITVPVHQRTDNFDVIIESESPLPLALTSMMWEGNYSPRYYRRT